MTADSGDVASRLADLNPYGKALNSADDEEDVVAYSLEAMSVLLELPYATFVSVRSGDPVVADSTYPNLSAGDDAGEPARRALASRDAVTVSGEDAAAVEGPPVEEALAVPVLFGEEPVAVLVGFSAEPDAFDERTVRPLEILATHVATGLGNIRSRQELERARRGVEARNEMIEMYSQLFRHHLRNDLNVVSGYADMLEEAVEDEGELDGDEAGEHVRTIKEAAGRSIDLVDRVSALHTEIKGVEEPGPRSLRGALAAAVEHAEEEYDDLTVEFDPDEFDYGVYAGSVLDRAFENLLGNAAVHNEGEVTVTLDVEAPTPTWVVVVIGDDGRGIDESVQRDLIELGIKGPASEGSGLGLGFVRQMIESYGGTVAAGASPRGGAEFRVTRARM